MFRYKPHVFLKRLIQSHPSTSCKVIYPNLNYPYINSFVCHYKIPTSFFSSSQNPQRTIFKEEEMTLLADDFPPEDLPRFTRIMKKYSECQDLTPGEILGVSFILYNLSAAHFLKNDLEKAYKYLIEDEDLHKKAGIKDTFNLAENYYKRATINMSQRNWTEAEQNLKEVARICQLFDSHQEVKSLMLESKSALAYLLFEKGQDLDQALSLSHSVLENIGDLSEEVLPGYLLYIHSMMGSIYSERNDLEKSIDSWTKGLEMATKYAGENSKDAYLFYRQIGKYLNKQGQSQRALQYAKKSLEVSRAVFSKDSEEVAESEKMLGDVYAALKDYTQALDSYQNAVEFYEKSPKKSKDNLIHSYQAMSEIYMNLGDSKEANSCLDKADKILKERS